LDSDLWKEVELKPKELRNILPICSKSCQLPGSTLGFTILDDQGKPIGVWYSILVGEISIKMLGDQKVIIYRRMTELHLL